MPSEPGVPRPFALIVAEDLFVSTRLRIGLEHMGYEAADVQATDVPTIVAARLPDIALVSFGRETFDAPALVESLKLLSPAPAVIGFVPHVQMPFVRPNAIRAGVDLLVANSAIAARLPQIVQKLLKRDVTGEQP